MAVMMNADKVGAKVPTAISPATTGRGMVYVKRPDPVAESTTGAHTSHAAPYAIRKKEITGRPARRGAREASGRPLVSEVVTSRLLLWG
jgi:hypothetical protein